MTELSPDRPAVDTLSGRAVLGVFAGMVAIVAAGGGTDKRPAAAATHGPVAPLDRPMSSAPREFAR